ncbi:MAG: AAA family ATPase [Oscillospiraceae bacterium]|nr:AAA family ATPase [Oscillospiraceae bacterium]
MPELVFVIGSNCSGKTYFIRRQYQAHDVDFFNIYDYQQRAYDEAGFGRSIPFAAQFRCLTKANEALLGDVIGALLSGRNVVVEHTLYKAKRRIAYIDALRKAVSDVRITVYVMRPSEGQFEANVKSRGLEADMESLKREAEAVEFPNPAEGFDAVYGVVDGEIRPRMELPRPELLAIARDELAKEAARIQKEDAERNRRKALLESMETRPFWHYCEVCGKKERITAQAAFDAGWDYPPNIGRFGLLGPRTCGSCLLKDTLFWKITTGGGLPVVFESELTPEELVTWRRIRGEPESLLEEEA